MSYDISIYANSYEMALNSLSSTAQPIEGENTSDQILRQSLYRNSLLSILANCYLTPAKRSELLNLIAGKLSNGAQPGVESLALSLISDPSLTMTEPAKQILSYFSNNSVNASDAGFFFYNFPADRASVLDTASFNTLTKNGVNGDILKSSNWVGGIENIAEAHISSPFTQRTSAPTNTGTTNTQATSPAVTTAYFAAGLIIVGAAVGMAGVALGAVGIGAMVVNVFYATGFAIDMTGGLVGFVATLQSSQKTTTTVPGTPPPGAPKVGPNGKLEADDEDDDDGSDADGEDADGEEDDGSDEGGTDGEGEGGEGEGGEGEGGEGDGGEGDGGEGDGGGGGDGCLVAGTLVRLPDHSLVPVELIGPGARILSTDANGVLGIALVIHVYLTKNQATHSIFLEDGSKIEVSERQTFVSEKTQPKQGLKFSALKASADSKSNLATINGSAVKIAKISPGPRRTVYQFQLKQPHVGLFMGHFGIHGGIKKD